MLVCINCKQGLMDPVRSEDEPEYTDHYQCGHCGHSATIPSLLIIISQILSGLLGGGLTLYLMLIHADNALSAREDEASSTFMIEAALVGLAVLLLAGFAYTLYRAACNLIIRHRYRHPGTAS